MIVVAGLEVASLEQTRADRRRVVGPGLVVGDRGVVRRARREALDRDARLRLRAAEDSILRVAHAGDAGNPREAAGEVLHECVAARLVIAPRAHIEVDDEQMLTIESRWLLLEGA